MTRMWLGVDPGELCDQHLLGEHAELHQEIGTLRNHPHGEAVVDGHIEAGQVDLAAIEARHDKLAEELLRRGYSHDSPLEYDTHRPTNPNVHEQTNREDLGLRCEDCRHRMQATAGAVGDA